MAQRFAIRDLDEAKAYLAHPLLGRRGLKAASELTLLGARVAVDFEPQIAYQADGTIKLMDARIFRDELMGLAND